VKVGREIVESDFRGADSQAAASNLAKHEVAFEEAAVVFGDPLGRIAADPRHSSEEERFVSFRLPCARSGVALF